MSKYNQLCVMEYFAMEKKTMTPEILRNFRRFMKKYGFRIKYEAFLERYADGNNDKEDKGVMDLLFYVHDDELYRFSFARFDMEFRIKWWEDVAFYNNHADRYPVEFVESHPSTWPDDEEDDPNNLFLAHSHCHKETWI